MSVYAIGSDRSAAASPKAEEPRPIRAAKLILNLPGRMRDAVTRPLASRAVAYWCSGEHYEMACLAEAHRETDKAIRKAATLVKKGNQDGISPEEWHALEELAALLSEVKDGIDVVGCTTGIRFAAAAHTRLVQVVNNHITGCTTGILSLYDGTAQIPILCMGNRLRNTTNVDGFDNWYAATGGDLRNTVTAGTDAGDYVNPSLNDYRIKSGSPGATAGLGGLSAGSRGSDARGGVLLRPGRAGRF